MSLVMRVEWPNADHRLLRLKKEKGAGPDDDVSVTVSADGKALPTALWAEGTREFDIPDGSRRVVLHAKFVVAFEKIHGLPDTTATVLEVEQTYDVVGGTTLQPVAIPAYGGGPHPLLDTKAVGNNVNGVALVRIHTEWVDITPFWMAFGNFAKDYARDHQPGTTLVALAYTGPGGPLIWFASVPDACVTTPKSECGCLIFFSPNTHASYAGVGQHHDMDSLNRYLLKPDPAATSAEHKRADKFVKNTAKDEIYLFVRAGFENALAKSGKAVVVLQPLPSGANFGVAVTNLLPELATRVICFLWAKQCIGKGQRDVTLGRVGLSGYSFGAMPMWRALRANVGDVHELYVFDGRDTKAHAADVIQWFESRDDNVLRMSGADQNHENHAILHSIMDVDPGAASRVTATPPLDSYDKPHGNPLWDHVLSRYPNWRGESRARHQFAIFGGYAPPPGTAVTFLQEFLEGSQF